MKAIHGYVHHDKSFGVMVEFEVGTDFTVRTPEFKAFAERIAMAFGLNSIREDAPPMGEGFAEYVTHYRTLHTTMADSEDTIETVLKEASKTFHEPVRITGLWDTRTDR